MVEPYAHAHILPGWFFISVPAYQQARVGSEGRGPCLLGTDLPCGSRFADQCGARAALSLSFLAASALYLLLVASCSPALPGVFLLFASRLPSVLMHTLPGRHWWVGLALSGKRGEMRMWLQVGDRQTANGIRVVVSG